MARSLASGETEKLKSRVARIRARAPSAGDRKRAALSALREVSDPRSAIANVARLNRDLHASIEELETVLSMVPLGIAIAHDPECRRITVNRYMSDLIAVPLEQNASLATSFGRSAYAFYRAGKKVPLAELPLRRACRGTEVADVELDLVRKGAPSRRLLCFARPLFDQQGKVRGSVGAFVDVTDARRHDREFRVLAEHTPAMVARLDRNHRHLYVNPQVESATGLADVDYIGKTNRELGMPEAICEAGDERIRNVFATGTEQALEFSFATPAGVRYFQSWFGPEHGDGGNVETVICITRDVTDERVLQDQLRGKIAELAESNRRKDEFLAMLGHELRNPLAPMRSAVEFLRLKEDLPSDIQRASTLLERQVTSLTRLVDDLLDVSRISHGQIHLRTEAVTLAAVLSNAIENSRPVLQSKGHHLSLDLPDENVIVDADIVRLAQVFTNLLNNAARYTPATGKIAIKARRVENLLTVEISDNGIGIAKAELQRIFEPFFRAGRSPDSPAGGLGVGLALVKQLIDLHRGTVEATSPGNGKGSTFIVKLPCRPAASAG